MPAPLIAFLRAVNVGGRVVKMTRLRELFEELGFSDVRTFIQSGNVFFTAPKRDRAALERRITAHLTEALGYEVPTMLRTIDDVESAIALDPFRSIKVTPEVRLCVLFTSAPLPDDVKLPMDVPKLALKIVGKTRGEAFVVLRRDGARAVNPAAFVEKTFGVKATARFFHTTKKILAAAKGQ